MEQLFYIDEHAITVEANRADTWSALLRMMCRDPDDPAGVPIGFVLDEARPLERFALKGRHLFAVYRWVFELDAEEAGQTRVRSATWANFPGVHGKIYRALVISSGLHKIVVRRSLKNIAAEACTGRAQAGETASDYTDVFEAPILDGDQRPAEQMLRDAVSADAGGGLVLWIHRHILRFRLGPSSSPDHVIGWLIAHSDHDEIVLTTSGPLMRGELTLRRLDGRRATLTTRVHYGHRAAARTVWAMVGPVHRAIAPQLVKRATRDQRGSAHAHHS